MTTTHLVSLA
jgi:hypothetical protein